MNFVWNLQNLAAAAAILFYKILYESQKIFHALFKKHVHFLNKTSEQIITIWKFWYQTFLLVLF